MVRSLLGLLCLLLVTGPWIAMSEQASIPTLKARVTDNVGILTPPQIDLLDKQLAELEIKKGSQLAILIVPTTYPETIEQYTLRVAEQWKIGRKRVDDGILLLIALNDRRLRIEVGYGLEGALTDLQTKYIIDRIITPHFRQEHHFAGISAGVAAITAIVMEEPLPPSSSPESNSNEAILSVIFFVLIFGAAPLKKAVGLVPAATMLGGTYGAVALPLVGTPSALVLGIIMCILTLVALSNRLGTGPSSNSWTSWGGTSGGGMSGGFRGGGGSFGGGGASGGW